MSTITVRIAKLGQDVTFAVESLPPTSLAYAITYGLTQSVNDAAAGVVRKNFQDDATYLAEVAKKTDKRLAQIESGDVPGSRAPADPTKAKLAQLVKSAKSSGMSDDEIFAALEAAAAKKAKATAKAA
jgi:hypothetical protein